MKSKYFKAYELVSEIDYDALGEAKVWEIMDPRIIETIDTMKEKFSEGSMIINNWKWNGDRNWSGLRTAGSKYWRMGSMHSYGKAVDCVFSAYDEAEVRKYIIDHPDEFPYVKGIENFKNMGWVHVDVRDRDDVIVFTG